MKTCLFILFSLLTNWQSPSAFTNVQFANNSSAVSADYLLVLKATALSLKTSQKHCLISGYAAHSEGTYAHTLRISKDRAQAIFDYLVHAGVKKEQLSIRFRGINEPIADNSTENGRELNRRVQFKVLD